MHFTEDMFENAVIELFENMGYAHIYAPDMERDYSSPLLDAVLMDSLVKLNKGLPLDAITEAVAKLRTFDTGSLVQKNMTFMDYLQNGLPVKYFEKGEERSTLIKLIDYKNVKNNSFYVVNQFTYIENGNNRRPDIILFINGMPLVLMELKSPSKDEVNAENAYNQIRNYMQDIPSMFNYNAICVISDLTTNKAGTITSGLDRFMEWKTKDGSYENTAYAQFDTFYEGMFQQERLLDIIKNFICFSVEQAKAFKILAGYHQYFAVRKAVAKAQIATIINQYRKGKQRISMDVIAHYDLLIDENNDPVNDPRPLQEYMDKWDGQPFIDALRLDKTKTVLEVGVGTGRLAVRIAPLCKHFTGVDISPKTIERANQHLKKHNNVTLICGDYTTCNFDKNYDVIYSSLTWMHIQNKQFAIDKTVDLLNATGRFVLSISKDQSNVIDFGTRKIAIYPDNPDSIETGIKNSGLVIVRKIETENAYIFISEKR